MFKKKINNKIFFYSTFFNDDTFKFILFLNYIKMTIYLILFYLII